jgi:ketosteroid isomerase-like protein
MKTRFKTISAIILVAFSTLAIGQEVPSAGKVFQEGKDKGKTYELGNDKAMNIVLESMKAYNSNDAKKDLSFYSDKMVKETSEFSTNWHKSMKTLNQQPIAMVPLRIKGSNENLVFSISQEDREWNNGSKQKLYLFELYTINKAGKISDFLQFQSIPSTNEFGLTDGGKIYLKDGTSTFTFSNRGEVATIEKMAAAFNKMDGEAYSAFFEDSVDYYHSNGEFEKITTADLKNYFAKLESVNWKINGILPFKITDTDPVSGIFVSATAKWVSKNGTVGEREQMLQYTYGLNGKISKVNSFGKDVKPVSKEAKLSALKVEIAALEKTWDTYFNSGDLESLLTLYADDAVRLPSNQMIISGKEAIKKEMEVEQTKLKKGYTNTSETIDVFGDENMVTEIGKTIRKDASGKVKSTGKYITIWKKINGKFVTIREMWNDDTK